MGKKKPKKGASSLGRALTRDKRKTRTERRQGNGAMGGKGPDPIVDSMFTTDEGSVMDKRAAQLMSVTDESDLQLIMNDAQLTNRQFVGENAHTVVIQKKAYMHILEEPTEEQREMQRQHYDALRVPRRPAWHKGMTGSEVDANERTAFLEWRRRLGELEAVESLLLSPFEKNLEVWRQLWRVVERCDVLVQIVDARNPLLFRCADLDAYAAELSADSVQADEASGGTPRRHRKKQTLLLLNKADLLTREQRDSWAQYFRGEGIDFVFWSAVHAQNLIDADLAEGVDTEPHTFVFGDDEKATARRVINTAQIATREQLFALFLSLCDVSADKTSEELEAEMVDAVAVHMAPRGASGRRKTKNAKSVAQMKASIYSIMSRTQVGFIGYPNVGKSSTINALMGTKKVAVKETPGKTKHFQTLLVGEKMCLCDCPGLVFPNFVLTKADMVCSGLLPIDQLKDALPSITLICQRIPRAVLEAMYGLVLPAPPEGDDAARVPTAWEFLNAYATMRGYMTSGGMPDVQRGARYILKEYVRGKLLYVFPPPNVDAAQFHKLATQQLLKQYAVAVPRADESDSDSDSDSDADADADADAGGAAAASVQLDDGEREQYDPVNTAKLTEDLEAFSVYDPDADAEGEGLGGVGVGGGGGGGGGGGHASGSTVGVAQTARSTNQSKKKQRKKFKKKKGRNREYADSKTAAYSGAHVAGKAGNQWGTRGTVQHVSHPM